jgi:LysR family hydrogen peroxide-inducible transcriptional activator
MNNHPFTLRQLQYAVAVADTLSFRRAAERCHVSQPSLSTQLAQLEATLGVTLFERDRRHVLPTAAGAPFIERARRLLVDADDLQRCARGAADPLAGTLRIGILPTIAPYLLPSVAPALRRAFPALSPVWVEDKTAALARELTGGSLDAAVLALEADVGEVEHARIALDPFVLATAPGSPLGRSREPVTSRELRDADVLLLDDGHCLRAQALTFCARSRAHELAFRATSLSTLAQMVANGSGVTLLPLLAVPTEAARAGLVIRRFAEPEPARTLSLVWRPSSAIAAALQRLATVMREAYPREAVPKPRRGSDRTQAVSRR